MIFDSFVVQNYRNNGKCFELKKLFQCQKAEFSIKRRFSKFRFNIIESTNIFWGATKTDFLNTISIKHHHMMMYVITML